MTLLRLGADATADDLAGSLDERGYAVVEGVLSPDDVAARRGALDDLFAATPTGRNFFEGFHTQRVYALFAKTRAFDDLAVHPLLLGALEHALGEHYQLSAPVGLQIGPGEKAQVLHRDEDVYPLPRPHDPVVLNSMWALCDFSDANGATRLIPGSHLWDPERRPDEREVVHVTMPAGSLLVYLGGVVHGGGANTTTVPRPGLLLEYVVSWLRPQETQLIAVPPDIVRDLPERLQELLGYNVYPPFLGYVDGRHPRRVLNGNAPHTVDPLRQIAPD
ncbi:MAG TPA: phytanoyl-CoA dioxygenase family protein [Acidimicrobiales bacterium]|nr:phytanoyl-CoA dioxygenase family protein [Acidimicrobiales bacterium]